MTHFSHSLTQSRLRSLTIIIPVVLLILLGRLFYWQIIRGPELKTKASRQHQQVTTLIAKRGDITDKDGNVLASTKLLYHLFVYKPQLEISQADLIEKILPLIKLDEVSSTESQMRDYLSKRLSLSSNWISVKHYLSPEEKQQIDSLNILGVGFEDEYQRFYPESSMSAHILGFVGQDAAGQEQGYFGLEGFFDRQLKGRGGKIRTERDAKGNPILIGNYSFLHAIEGSSIVSTIDKKTQFIVEKTLREGIERYQATAGSAIVIETSTGKIRAMASYPNYDPSHFSDFPQIYYRNPVVADLFEPGSIFKPLVIAAALNENLITPDTKCDICSSPIKIDKYFIKTWDGKYRPDATMTDVIIHSDNTGMVFAARKLGKEKFAKYLNEFGFGQKTGIELQEEVPGLHRDANDYKDIDIATNSFGQGIAVTGIQMVSAINVLANNGYYIKPTLIEETTAQPRPILNSQAVKDITQIMIKAVEQGESKWAKPKGILIAGKTGTAQIPIEGHYDLEKTIASFVGFFPADRPKYTMLVTLREPQTSQWGSETAAPLWFLIAKQLML